MVGVAVRLDLSRPQAGVGAEVDAFPQAIFGFVPAPRIGKS